MVSHFSQAPAQYDHDGTGDQSHHECHDSDYDHVDHQGDESQDGSAAGGEGTEPDKFAICS
jgi:hypothetical protein